jgi:hypothetical protein
VTRVMSNINAAAIAAMKSRVRSILVNDLKSVCRDESLPVSGSKALLQQRIIGRTCPSYHVTLHDYLTYISSLP